MSSVSSCTSSSEDDEVADSDDELVDKDLRKVQKKSLFGFQVRGKKKENEKKDEESDNEGSHLPKTREDEDSD